MRLWSAALLVLGLAACGAETSDQLPTAPEGDPPAQGAFDITVGPGRTPTFTWAGGPKPTAAHTIHRSPALKMISAGLLFLAVHIHRPP